MGAPFIPDWKERLKACFRWRHRFMHVFGAPAALGALAAMGSSAALNPDVGLGLGALTTAVGVLLAGYYVTAGFDRGLVSLLTNEKQYKDRALEDSALRQAIDVVLPEVRPIIDRIVWEHGTIEGVFTDGIDDAVEAVLQNSRPDLRALRDRAISLAGMHRRLNDLIMQFDGRWLQQEVQRMTQELTRSPDGPVRDALVAAKESTERAFVQWQTAVEKQGQIRNVLTVIESNLHEFRLAMELRKADAAMGGAQASLDVSELQSRLAAAGEACDELVGRSSATSHATRRRRA